MEPEWDRRAADRGSREIGSGESPVQLQMAYGLFCLQNFQWSHELVLQCRELA